jgi:hypothetical protein
MGSTRVQRSLALLWQILLDCLSLQIGFRQCGHRCGVAESYVRELLSMAGNVGCLRRLVGEMVFLFARHPVFADEASLLARQMLLPLASAIRTPTAAKTSLELSFRSGAPTDSAPVGIGSTLLALTAAATIAAVLSTAASAHAAGCTPNHELYRIVPEYRVVLLDGSNIKRVMFVDWKDERLSMWKPGHNITFCPDDDS